MENYDVVVLGAGPAGLAAALSSHKEKASTLIIEREGRSGGILKQCIHDGFGLIRFGERLTGPEYAEKYIKMIKESNIPLITSTFVIDVRKQDNKFILSLVNNEKGVYEVSCSALVLANGCRERTSRQIFIQGSRPAGIFTAGTAQYFVNIKGYMPCKKCIILGSGDIGLIMARRLTLEGSKVIGVYEAKPTPSGLTRNIIQCLEDYDIPLHLSQTVTKIIGDHRVEAVEICTLDKNMKPIKGSEEIIECDGVILSVGLIPENEIAEKLGVKIDISTKGPYVDQNFMTSIEGVFSCGNALHVNDLVDYVSESGVYAGKAAADYAGRKSQNYARSNINILYEKEKFLYVVPQYFDINSKNKKVTLYLRSSNIKENVEVQIIYNDKQLFKKRYKHLRPPEMERIQVELDNVNFHEEEFLEIIMQEV